MLGEADLKDFFAEPIKTPSQQNTVKMRYIVWTSPQSCDIQIIQ